MSIDVSNPLRAGERTRSAVQRQVENGGRLFDMDPAMLAIIAAVLVFVAADLLLL